MARTDTFTFRVDDVEKRLILSLSQRLQRTPSDMVRFVLRETAKALDSASGQPDALPAVGEREAVQ